MSGLDDIVNLTITSETVAPSRQGFGVPLVLCFTTAPNPSTIEVKSTKDLPSSVSKHSPAYRMLATLFSQEPFRVAKAHVVFYPAGASALEQTVTLSPLSTDPTVSYRFTLDSVESVEVDVPVDSAMADDEAKIADVCAKIAAALNGKAGIVATVVNDGESVKITKAAQASGESFALIDLPPPAVLRVQDTGPNLPVTDALDWAEATIDGADWYGLLLAYKQGNAVTKAADWIAQRRKILVAHIDADRFLTIAGSLKDSGFARVIPWYHENSLFSTIDAAILSANLPITPGHTTWVYKPLVGVKPDRLKPSRESAIKALNGGYYTRTAGLNVSRTGKVSAGEWADTVHFIDYLFARIQETVFGRIATASAAGRKIPFTDSGAETFRAAVLQVMSANVVNDRGEGGLADDPAPWVQIPSVADIPAEERKERRLPRVQFGARLSGAILATDITGSVTD